LLSQVVVRSSLFSSVCWFELGLAKRDCTASRQAREAGLSDVDVCAETGSIGARNGKG